MTNWARAVGLVTVLAAHEVPQTAVTDIEPYIGGTGSDLLKPFAEAISAYHDEAQEQQAGPLAFFWLVRAAAPFASHFRPDATPAVRDYLDGTTAEDRVRQFLLSSPGRGGDVPSRRDGTWREWACALFNGRRHGWTRDGLLHVAALLLTTVITCSGLAIWAVSTSRVEAFRLARLSRCVPHCRSKSSARGTAMSLLEDLKKKLHGIVFGVRHFDTELNVILIAPKDYGKSAIRDAFLEATMDPQVFADGTGHLNQPAR